MPRFFKPQQRSKNALPKIAEPLLIERLSDDGRGIAHYQGKLVFVAGALTGELALVRVIGHNSRYLDAKAVSIDKPSSSRVSPQCRHAVQCGGCTVQYMDHALQRDFKQQALHKQSKQQGLNPQQCIEPLYDAPFAYRSRIRLGVSVDQKGTVSLGFRQQHSQQLVAITECPVMMPNLSSLLEPLHDWLKTLRNAPVTHIELVGQEDCGVVIRHTRAIPIKAKQALSDQLQTQGVATWFQGTKQGSLMNAQEQPVDPRLAYDLAEQSLRLYYHPQDFIQANPQVNAKMVNQALSLLKPRSNEHFVDLFCGIGNFSLPLSQQAAKVYGYEGVQTMVDRATANAEANKCNNVTFSQADLAASNASVYDVSPIDGLLLDPPRTGAKVVCANIAKLAPKRIVYVSCNTATFTRDAQILCANGYQLAASGVMDMFPQTSHSEVIGLFHQS